MLCVSYMQYEKTIFMFMPSIVTQGTMVHFMIVSSTLLLGYSQLMIKQSLSVMRMLITRSGWSRSLQLIGTGVMLLIFTMSRCEELVCCPTHIAGNRLDLVMTDGPDTVDVFVGTPFGTSDHCFVSCVFNVEESVPKYKCQKCSLSEASYKLDSVRSAIRNFTWSTILKSADPLGAFNRAICEDIGRYVLTTVLCTRSGDEQWFDASCQRAYDAKQTAYRTWCRAHSAEHWGQFILARAEAQRVYGAARESHNERTGILRSTPNVHISGGDTERLDFCCESVYSCSQWAHRWFGGGSC